MATYAAKGDRFEPKTIKKSSIKNPVDVSNTGRGLSPGLWNTCPVELLKANPLYGNFFFDDFIDGIDVAANSAVATVAALGTTGKWGAFTAATAGTVIATAVDNYQGVVKLETDTIDEDAAICYPKGGHIAGKYKFASTTRLWMEARVSILNITTNKFNAFFGFAEEGLMATTTLITASDAMADKDYVGFQKTFAGTTGIASVYNTAGGATSPATVAAAAATVTADTFTKIGIYCDGTTVYFYQNGAKGTGITIATADFPDGEEMAFYAGIMAGHGDKCSISLDWVALAQAYSLVDPVGA